MQLEWALPVWAWPLVAIAALAAFLWTRRQYAASEPRPQGSVRAWLTGLRSLALLFLLLALAGPSLYRISRQHRPAEVVVVTEDSASMQLASAAIEGSRWDRARMLTRMVDSLLATRDEPVRITHWRGNGLSPLRQTGPDAGGDEPPVSVGSDLAALIHEISARWAERPLRAVVLVGDGNDTTPRSEDAGSLAATTHAAHLLVGVGDPVGPPDRVIQDLRYPEIAFQEDEVVVEVSVASRGTTDQVNDPVVVRLLDGERVVARSVAEPALAGELVRLELTFVPETAGLHVFELEVTPLANERFRGNNRATLAINVRKERARLLLLTGRPGWDTRFLAQAATSEPRLQMEVVYQGRSGLLLAENGSAWQMPADRAGWSVYDGVVLDGWQDLEPDLNWSELAAAVRLGLGLCVLAKTTRSDPQAAQGLPLRIPAALAEILPVQLQGGRWLAGEWTISVALDSGRHPVLAGVTRRRGDQTAGSLDMLPPLSYVATLTPRPGAEVLLTALPRRSDPDLPAQTPLLIVDQHIDGRVAWFGGNRLWEILFWEAPLSTGSLAEQPARRLLRNLLIWTVSGAEDSGLGLVGHRTVYQQGERIRLEARWHDIRGEAVRDRQLNLRLQALDEAVGFKTRIFSMTADPARPGHAQVELPPLPAGRYSVRPEAATGFAQAGREAHLVITPNSLEAAQVRQDRRRLRQLEAQLSGSYIAGESPAAQQLLAAALATVPLEGNDLQTRQRHEIWAGWPLLGMVVLLLGSEWGLRKRHGLL